MSNLVDYAKEELKRIGMIDSGESYNDWVTEAILDLIELFSSQGHSGFSASYVVNAFSRLAMYKPLSPLTGEDDEWNDIGDCLQNKRYSAVFKDKDGTAYNIDGKAFTDDGEVWYTCKDSRVNVTFPYVVPDKPERVYRNKDDKDEGGKRMELETVVKLIGCLVVAVLIFAIPCLATLAFALNWDAFLKYLFTILSICVICTMVTVLYEEIR